ncbi:MAG TPA: glycoside hydrolase family 43 protein [Tepidisphaeraceae bacterium]|jgi:GH43 family beta-xylosidase|nr:glycoside hydrolase family 43 protein [Tepidisphaeraceae bacterium]
MSRSAPLILQRADPFVLRHVDGWYYFTASVPEYDRIELRRARSIAALATAEPVVVWRKHSEGAMGGYIWAPELHVIDGRWFVYFAAGHAERAFEIRIYALACDAANPLDSAWRECGQIRTSWESFALDATTFTHRNTRYLAWAQNDPAIGPGTSIYLAAMDGPLKIAGQQVAIARPTHAWERIGHHVNEGPAVLVRNGRVFMTFSASATDANYCMGLLTAAEDADLLDPASWKKVPTPVKCSSEAAGEYGPGHNSFTVSEDGQTDLLVYHARDYRDIEGEPLFDPNRHTRVQPIIWSKDGAPLFDVPLVGR